MGGSGKREERHEVEQSRSGWTSIRSERELQSHTLYTTQPCHDGVVLSSAKVASWLTSVHLSCPSAAGLSYTTTMGSDLEKKSVSSRFRQLMERVTSEQGSLRPVTATAIMKLYRSPRTRDLPRTSREGGRSPYINGVSSRLVWRASPSTHKHRFLYPLYTTCGAAQTLSSIAQ